MKRFLLLFTAFFLFLPSIAGAVEIEKGQNLTLEQCMEIALERHPDLRGAKARIDARESIVSQVRTAWKPEADLSSSYNRRSVTDEGYDRYSSSVTVSQLISDGGKTRSQVNVAEIDLQSSEYDYDDMVQTLVFDVKDTYFALLRANKEEEVVQEAVKMYEHHLEQARGYYEVGRVSRYDVTTAEVDLSNARLNLIRAKTSVKTARSGLNNALGYPDAPLFSIEDMLTYEKIELTREKALAMASDTRPDLKSLEAKKRASEESVVLAARSNSPTLSATAGYSWGDDDFTGDEELYAGVSLNVSLYDGGLAKEKIREARADLVGTDADLQGLEQDVILEVEKAYLEVQDSEQAILTADKIVQQARENLDLANGRYEVGVGSPVEVTDATENYINARNTYYTALYDYRSALAALEKAIGGKVK